MVAEHYESPGAGNTNRAQVAPTADPQPHQLHPGVCLTDMLAGVLDGRVSQAMCTEASLLPSLIAPLLGHKPTPPTVGYFNDIDTGFSITIDAASDNHVYGLVKNPDDRASRNGCREGVV